ncbi:MAG: BatA domain-containing protein [Chitinophagales bacterium]|nr:BatA domain-containing protein [Chitinophagales bacterium]
MHFVFPAFLIALVVLAIPIIIHLFYFRKYKKVYFSDIRTLKEVQEEKSTVEQLKKRLILASRLLALFFLVLAFAQPFLGKKDNKQNENGNALSVYIDNSYSMGLKEGTTDNLTMAKQKAIELVNDFNNTDQFCLLTNTNDIQTQKWMTKEDFIDAVDKVELVNQNKNISEINQKQAALFQGVGNKNKLAFIISDFQKYITNNLKDTSFTTYLLPLPTGNEKNVFVDSCWFENPVFTTNSTNKLLVRFKNSGNSKVDKLSVSIKINNQVKAVDEIEIEPQNFTIDSFNINITKSGMQSGVISFKDYPISFDDNFYFNFNIQSSEKVLNIESGSTPSNITSIFSNDNYFQLTTTNNGKIDYSSFNQYGLIILNQLNDISSGLSNAIKEYLENGGNVLVIPSENINLNSYNNFFSNNGIAIISNLVNVNGKVTQLNLNEDIFKGVFDIIPKNIDLPTITQMYRQGKNSTVPEKPILITNVQSPLFTKFEVANGLLYWQATPNNVNFSNIATKAIYPPIVYNCGIYKKQINPLYYTIGSDNLIAIKDNASNQDQSIVLQNQDYEFIPENRMVGNTVYLGINQDIPIDGFYKVKRNDQTINEISFNYNRQESNLSFTTTKELKNLYTKDNAVILNNSIANLSAKVKQIKEGTILWKIALLLCLVALIVEALLIRFLK